MEAFVDFVVLSHVPFDTVIGIPTLNLFGGVLDFKGDEFRFDYCGKTAVVQMIPK